MQISPFQSGGGPNGVGGITVEGTPTGLKMETDKKGITRLSMNVTGNGISAQVTVTLSPSDNRATATIIPNFNSLNVTLDADYRVMTDYDPETDFSQFRSYYLADSILFIGQDKILQYLDKS